MPIFEGNALIRAILRLDLTVRNLADHLMKFLVALDNDIELNSTVESSDKNQT